MKDKDFSNWPSSNTIHGLPKSHWTVHLRTFIDPKPALVDAVVKFKEQWQSRQIPAPRLILSGEQGRGKTHIAVGLYRHCVYETSLTHCKYVHVPTFCKAVRDGFGDRNDPFEVLEGASIIVLDDMFGIGLKPHDREDTIPRLITLAYDNNQSLVVTSNYHVTKEMPDLLLPHEMSRLLQNAIPVHMSSTFDYRLKK